MPFDLSVAVRFLREGRMQTLLDKVRVVSTEQRDDVFTVVFDLT